MVFPEAEWPEGPDLNRQDDQQRGSKPQRAQLPFVEQWVDSHTPAEVTQTVPDRPMPPAKASTASNIDATCTSAGDKGIWHHCGGSHAKPCHRAAAS
jgi:hypothetical protein